MLLKSLYILKCYAVVHENTFSNALIQHTFKAIISLPTVFTAVFTKSSYMMTSTWYFAKWTTFLKASNSIKSKCTLFKKNIGLIHSPDTESSMTCLYTILTKMLWLKWKQNNTHGTLFSLKTRTATIQAGTVNVVALTQITTIFAILTAVQAILLVLAFCENQGHIWKPTKFAFCILFDTCLSGELRAFHIKNTCLSKVTKSQELGIKHDVLRSIHSEDLKMQYVFDSCLPSSPDYIPYHRYR